MLKLNRVNYLFLTGLVLFSSAIHSASANVITSVRPLGFIAAAIADGVTETQVLLPNGASPHDYALKPSDIKRIRDADLVVWVGPELEGFLKKPLEQVDSNRQIALATVPAISALIHHEESEHEGDHDHGHKHADDDDGHHHGSADMHVWMSPEIAKISAQHIYAKLLERMPQKKEKLDANLHQFEQELEQTRKNIVNITRSLHGKGYFVFHDAYGYFERAFGLTQLGHFTINPEIQPGAQRLHEIRTQLVEHKAQCVFAEPQFRPAVINAVAQGTKAKMGTLDPLGSDIALGKNSYSAFLTQLTQQFSSCLK